MRRLTREVRVGSVGIGGRNPIRIQSMTTTNTLDVTNTVMQSIRMIEAGCELVRITAPSQNEARALRSIRTELHKRGYTVPLIADIHFTPKAAEIAADIVEKVRINPGNYADRKKFEDRSYSDQEYANELDRIRERFTPLVERCKSNGVAMRIGTNHGSLSDRILGRYGDTPEGMVESALEFVRICQDLNYHDIILSMKASNPLVMVAANRLLIQRMDSEGMDYPIHLGVTEAGEGEDGRIKSAVGIGTLLQEGIGDTIRVSLTEEPEAELPVARELVTLAGRPLPEPDQQTAVPTRVFSGSASDPVLSIGGGQVPVVVGTLSVDAGKYTPDYKPLGYEYLPDQDQWRGTDQSADFAFITGNNLPRSLPAGLNILGEKLKAKNGIPVYSCKEILGHLSEPVIACRFGIAEWKRGLDPEILKSENLIWILDYPEVESFNSWREIIAGIRSTGNRQPILLHYQSNRSGSTWLLEASIQVGSLFLEKAVDGIWLDVPDGKRSVEAAFGILQAVRARISKTEYISCPSCGRTLFDLQKTTALIRSRTAHLKGVKIGIMGCVVNGPGEMADADYGYVGTGPGKIALYKGQNVIHRDIPADQAVDRLIDLIREHGDWVDPPNPEQES